MTVVGWGSALTAVPAGTGEVVTMQLEVAAEPGLLISRLNPPVVELNHPFRLGDVLTAVMDGELYPDDPKVYYAHLNPVIWELTVPRGTPPRSYPADVRATFAFCSKTLGFCFTDEQTAATTVQVGGGETTVTLQLRQPKP